jgi:hypothetical protein
VDENDPKCQLIELPLACDVPRLAHS